MMGCLNRSRGRNSPEQAWTGYAEEIYHKIMARDRQEGGW